MRQFSKKVFLTRRIAGLQIKSPRFSTALLAGGPQRAVQPLAPKIDGTGFADSDGSCRLTVGADGRTEATLFDGAR